MSTSSEQQMETSAGEAPSVAEKSAKTRSIQTAWTGATNAIADLFGTIRYNAVRALPAAIVNNSSNLLGVAHVFTEAIMFKASAADGILVKDATWWEWPFKAVVKIYKDAFNKAKQHGAPINFFEGNPAANLVKFIGDPKAATEREILAQGVTHAPENVKLNNNWQTRSTLAGLTVWGLSAVIPDKKESEEDIEHMAIMQKTQPVRYVGERLKQAVWFPEWPDHKRQMIGLGIFASGVFSILGAWRNRDKKAPIPKFKFRGDVLGTGLFTFASSFPLLFASDDQRGFGGFGALMMGRLLFLPGSIYGKFKDKEDGALSYFGASAAFQAENLTQALIGGAEKNPDGTIVDHQEIRKTIKQKAQKIQDKKANLADYTDSTPSTVISHVDMHAAAMPQRVAAHQEKQQAVAMPSA